MIERSDNNGIVTLRLAHGKAAALDVELMEGLARAMAEVALDDTRAVILTGTGNIFSAGVDLFRLTEAGDEYVERFVPALTRLMLDLFSFPKPFVVAANGHAIAGGTIIALTADYRIIVNGNARMGIPELLVGVPFPASVLEIIRFAVPPQHLQSLIYTGRTVMPEEARMVGFIDEIVAPETLLSRANEMATHLAALPTQAFQMAKRQLRDKAIGRAKHYANEFDATMKESWKAAETHAHVREYLARTVRK